MLLGAVYLQLSRTQRTTAVDYVLQFNTQTHPVGCLLRELLNEDPEDFFCAETYRGIRKISRSAYNNTQRGHFTPDLPTCRSECISTQFEI